MLRTFVSEIIRVAGAITLLCAALACGPRSTEHPEWGARFEAAGIRDGCLTIYDEAADRFHRYNPERCARGFLPASTFKIFNSLVALESGVAPDVEFTLPWDGEKRWLPVWNQDHSMRSAIRYSVVWYYQEIARRIGQDRMRDFLRRAQYGNGDISAGIDVFWLEGGFRVSPEAQIDLLRRLRANALPFAPRTLDQVRSILIVEEQADYRLSAKTGLAVRDASAMIGWWVGYLEQNDNVYYFALNIAADGDENKGDAIMEFAGKRQPLVREILKSQFALF